MTKRNWLVWEGRRQCWWGPGSAGYWASILDAGLYTEAEAKAIETFAKKYGRHDVAVPLDERRAELLAMREKLDTLLAAL